jgi:ApaG protein
MTQLFKIEVIEETQDIISQQKPYQCSTHGIEIAVWPEYISNKITNIGEIYIWSYQVRIENRNKFAVKLISRYWKIIDENGQLQEVKGDGVIGEQPQIEAHGIFQYNSGIHLTCQSGIMSGIYKMINLKTQEQYEVTIPAFSLDAQVIKSVLN